MISENQAAQSSYVAYLQFKESERIRLGLIEPLVKRFFSARNIKDYKELSENSEISDLDFRSKDISYFYDFVFNEIKKNKEGKIELPTRYIITLDKNNCEKQCEKTDIFYDEIILNQKPVCYFIYISIEEIFSFLRKNNPSC
jgi:hypothetical protein